MPIPNFPSTLPKVIINSYSVKREPRLARTEMDTGQARVRRRSTAAPTTVSVTWQFTMSQYGTFEKWFQQDIFDGAGWFYILLVNGAGESSCKARFKELPSATVAGGGYNWTVTASLEVESMPLIA